MEHIKQLQEQDVSDETISNIIRRLLQETKANNFDKMPNPDPEQIKKIIPAKFFMISGSEDKQTSADVFNVNQFSLPNPAGKAGGACTSTLLSVLNQLQGAPISWIELLRQMRGVLRSKGFEQVPQLSTSRMIDVNVPFEIVPARSKQVEAARRALLIGINYNGAHTIRIFVSGCVLTY